MSLYLNHGILIMSIQLINAILPCQVETVTFLGCKEGRTWKGFFYELFQRFCGFAAQDASKITLEQVKNGYATPDFFAKKVVEDLQVRCADCGGLEEGDWNTIKGQLTTALKTQSFWSETFPQTDLGWSLDDLAKKWLKYANGVCEKFEIECGETVFSWSEEERSLLKRCTLEITSREKRQSVCFGISNNKCSDAFLDMQQMFNDVEATKKGMDRQVTQMRKETKVLHDAGLILFPESWETDLKRVVPNYDGSRLFLRDAGNESSSGLQQEMQGINAILDRQRAIFIQYCGSDEPFFFNSEKDREAVKAALFSIYKNVRHESGSLEYSYCSIESLRSAIKGACREDNSQIREANMQEIAKLREQFFCLEPSFREASSSLRQITTELQRLQGLDKEEYLGRVERECRRMQGLLDLQVEEAVYEEGASIEDKLAVAATRWGAFDGQIPHKKVELREHLEASAVEAERMKQQLRERADPVTLVDITGVEDMSLPTLKAKTEEMIACLAALNGIQEEQRAERSAEVRIAQYKAALEKRNGLIEKLKSHVHINNHLLVLEVEPEDWSAIDVTRGLMDCSFEVFDLEKKLGLVFQIEEKEAEYQRRGVQVESFYVQGSSTIGELEARMKYLNKLLDPAPPSLLNGWGLFA